MNTENLTVGEFARRFGICRATLYKHWRAGNGPRRFKVGRKTLIPETELVDWRESLIGSADYQDEEHRVT